MKNAYYKKKCIIYRYEYSYKYIHLENLIKTNG